MAFLLDIGFGEFLDLGAAPFYVGVIHDANSSTRPESSAYWNQLEISEIDLLLGADVRLYRNVRSNVREVPSLPERGPT